MKSDADSHGPPMERRHPAGTYGQPASMERRHLAGNHGPPASSRQKHADMAVRAP